MTSEGKHVLRLVTGACDNTVRIWKFEGNLRYTYRLISICELGQWEANMAGEWVEERKVGVGHSGEIPRFRSFPADYVADWVRDVAWAPNTAMPFNVIASCSEDKTVKIWKQVGVSSCMKPSW